MFMHKVLRRVFETKYREGGENHAVGGFVICFVTEAGCCLIADTSALLQN